MHLKKIQDNYHMSVTLPSTRNRVVNEKDETFCFLLIELIFQSGKQEKKVIPFSLSPSLSHTHTHHTHSTHTSHTTDTPHRQKRHIPHGHTSHRHTTTHTPHRHTPQTHTPHTTHTHNHIYPTYQRHTHPIPQTYTLHAHHRHTPHIHSTHTAHTHHRYTHNQREISLMDTDTKFFSKNTGKLYHIYVRIW